MALPDTASANDSEAETAIGGLRLIQSANISMDSEDLFISATQVRVKYRFTNNSKADVKALIAFPLPDAPGGANYVEDHNNVVDVDTLNFRTRVEGKPITLGVEYTAKVAGRNINARLKELGWPVRWHSDGDYLPNWPVIVILSFLYPPAVTFCMLSRCARAIPLAAACAEET
jgi:hypothetical protein